MESFETILRPVCFNIFNPLCLQQFFLSELLRFHLIFRVFHNILNVKKEEPKKKESVKTESKLKAFIKRSSEPLLNMQPMQQANKVWT